MYVLFLPEFGHNWGSEHDPDTTECSPNAFKGGKHIMYTYSVSGYDPNNHIFSPCSRRSMGAVLAAKSTKCFSGRFNREFWCGYIRDNEIYIKTQSHMPTLFGKYHIQLIFLSNLIWSWTYFFLKIKMQFFLHFINYIQTDT
jgi:hypothetical protein